MKKSSKVFFFELKILNCPFFPSHSPQLSFACTRPILASPDPTPTAAPLVVIRDGVVVKIWVALGCSKGFSHYVNTSSGVRTTHH